MFHHLPFIYETNHKRNFRHKDKRAWECFDFKTSLISVTPFLPEELGETFLQDLQ